MHCKIDHTDPAAIPAPLCRACTPSLTASQGELAALEAAERTRLAAGRAELSRKRELEKAQRKLSSITRRGEPDAGTVNAKIAVSLRRKISRLTAQEGAG